MSSEHLSHIHQRRSKSRSTSSSLPMPCVSTNFSCQISHFFFSIGFAALCGCPIIIIIFFFVVLMHLYHLALFRSLFCYTSSPNGLLSHHHDSITALPSCSCGFIFILLWLGLTHRYYRRLHISTLAARFGDIFKLGLWIYVI